MGGGRHLECVVQSRQLHLRRACDVRSARRRLRRCTMRGGRDDVGRPVCDTTTTPTAQPRGISPLRSATLSARSTTTPATAVSWAAAAADGHSRHRNAELLEDLSLRMDGTAERSPTKRARGRRSDARTWHAAFVVVHGDGPTQLGVVCAGGEHVGATETGVGVDIRRVVRRPVLPHEPPRQVLNVRLRRRLRLRHGAYVRRAVVHPVVQWSHQLRRGHHVTRLGQLPAASREGQREGRVTALASTVSLPRCTRGCDAREARRTRSPRR
jgi:hypothetical protein